jgi:hypothetical protein
MFVIKTAQLQQFIAANDNELAAVVADALSIANGTRVSEYDREQLLRMAKIGIARARSHGLSRAEDIAAFAAVMVEVAPRFDEQPEISGILSDETFSPEARFYQLFERVTPESWVDAQKKYDDTFWFGDEPAGGSK